MAILDTKLTLEWAEEHDACGEGLAEVLKSFPGRESITLRELLDCEKVAWIHRVWPIDFIDEVKDVYWDEIIGEDDMLCGCGDFTCALESLAAVCDVEESAALVFELLKMGGIE